MISRTLKSLRFILIALFFSIMLSAGALSVAIMIVLRHFELVPQSQPTGLVVITLLISTIIGTVITSLMSYYYVRPTKELISAAKEISKGNFNARVAVKEGSNSEFSELKRSFNQMAEDLGGIELFRNDFINSFSHEFKTPMVSIRGFAKQLKDEDLTSDERNEYIDIIISESDRLTKMASNVLLLSKLENQTIISGKTDYSLDEQLRQSVLLLERQWTKKNIDLDIELDPLTVNANAEITSQIWINLISNAIKFSPSGGKIGVYCRQENDMALVSVRDCGCGMNECELGHIFDKFYQADSSRKSEGNGLGLAIVGRIVDMYGGSINVKSTPGVGSEFTVLLDILKK